MDVLIRKNREFWESSQQTKFGSAQFYMANSLALAVLAKQLVTRDMTLLDIGCGNGENTLLLSRFCGRIIGFELSDNLIAEAKNNHSLNNGEYRKLDLEDKDWTLPAPVDMIFCLGVFSTIHDASAITGALRKFRAALKPGGVLVVRDSLSRAATYTKLHHHGYYGIYRSARHYARFFEQTGFSREAYIPLAEFHITNGLHIFRAAPDN